ncbi:hypothetical protein [Sphingomonas sp. G-3-2-10]|uniref:hypothetical protein n=1 Tax=Sphingomonas sp. G-3-2-10 TaxID=2728838 RepID=UPI00146F12EC|nr:hypothetical protein [Sphingomonas sp. G-3-2-10]NML04250.1 hypothetical protein [Sphingomonas sp. G-3-2-10]
MLTQTTAAPTRSNPALVISRFTSADKAATPAEEFGAHLQPTAEIEYAFETILDACAEAQAGQTKKDYFSFSVWDGGHDLEGHRSTTLITLEYHVDAVDDVREALAEMEFAHFEFATKADRKNVVMFAFPLLDHLDYKDTTRAASLIAAMVGVKGVVQHSWLYTYFFKFRGTDPVQYRDGNFVGRDFIEAAEGVFVQMKDYVR